MKPETRRGGNWRVKQSSGDVHVTEDAGKGLKVRESEAWVMPELQSELRERTRHI